MLGESFLGRWGYGGCGDSFRRSARYGGLKLHNSERQPTGKTEVRRKMFGRMQVATVRVAVDVSAEQLSRYLTDTTLLRRWVWPQQLEAGGPEHLSEGAEFYSRWGPARIGHQVRALGNDRMVLALWGAIDGWNEWRWGDGWVQLHVEGVSLLPLQIGLNVALHSLQRFVRSQQHLETIAR